MNRRPSARPLTIRRRLLLSFLVINALFAVNVAFFSWSNYRRTATIHQLRNAIEGEKSIGIILQKLDNIQKQITLMGQSVLETSDGLGAEEVVQFQAQLQEIRSGIVGLVAQSPPSVREPAEAFAADYEKLSASWLKFYSNFGVRHAIAITELAVTAEPLGARIHAETAPALLAAEKRSVEEASAHFRQVSEWTDRVSLVMFSISGIVALAIAYRLSRYLTTGLEELKQGVAAIGQGMLHQRIDVRARDELGELAGAFNNMADQLQAARSDLVSVNHELESRHEQVERQRQMSESLLHNILPHEVAVELRENQSVEPKYFEDVSILFTDIVGFTLSTESLAAEELVNLLHDYFTAFDEIAERYGIEKLKTVGDSYMCVSGMPTRTPSHPVDMVLAGLEMIKAVEELGRRPGSPGWSIRVGIHTGPVIAGVVGIKKFAFDVWGESVNYSSRMESSGEANRVNISERTYSRIKDFIECEYRGKIQTKDKRQVEMYFVRGVKPALMDGPPDGVPPAFARRYRVYFQKQPPAFPAFLRDAAVSTRSSLAAMSRSVGEGVLLPEPEPVAECREEDLDRR
ncbi:MAG: adenylate/guanylate cyclase domain-containing protein [Bryobacteraceae bacterium]